jgi:hypothetical protein
MYKLTMIKIRQTLLDVNNHTYIDNFERYEMEENSKWFNKPVFMKKRRKFMECFEIHKRNNSPSYFKWMAPNSPRINKYQVVERINTLNSCQICGKWTNG